MTRTVRSSSVQEELPDIARPEGRSVDMTRHHVPAWATPDNGMVQCSGGT